MPKLPSGYTDHVYRTLDGAQKATNWYNESDPHYCYSLVRFIRTSHPIQRRTQAVIDTDPISLSMMRKRLYVWRIKINPRPIPQAKITEEQS